MVHRQVEEALDLALVQVHRDHAIRARRRDEIRDELGGDGLTSG
jgi:hypothetical protein